MVKKYGLNMLVSTDDSLQSYLRKIMSQLNGARRLFFGHV
jgi:mitotic spindle assembly checkpoint protein MAD2